MKVLFLLGFGTLPFWIAILLVLAGSHNRTSDYWSAAPWLVVLSIPLCAVTFVMATIALVTYDRATGSKARKLSMGFAALAAQAGLVAVVAAFFKVRQMQREDDDRLREAAALEVVRNSAEVKRAAGGPFGASIDTRFLEKDVVTRYDVYVRTHRPAAQSGTRTATHFNVIVDVVQPPGSGYRIACLTRLEPGQRTATDACKDDDSRGRGRYATPDTP
jgi:hypothetical protein